MNRVTAFLSFILIVSACAHKTKRICDHIEMREGELALSRNEEVLVCGSDKGGEGWRQIPIPQAQYQLSVYLSNEGYFSPRFERQKDRLLVWSGPRTIIKSLKVKGAPPELKADKKRKIVDEPMEPARLDDVQQWGETELRNSVSPHC